MHRDGWEARLQCQEKSIPGYLTLCVCACITHTYEIMHRLNQTSTDADLLVFSSSLCPRRRSLLVDHARVVLPEVPGQDGSDYINASYLKVISPSVLHAICMYTFRTTTCQLSQGPPFHSPFKCGGSTVYRFPTSSFVCIFYGSIFGSPTVIRASIIQALNIRVSVNFIMPLRGVHLQPRWPV